MVWGRFEAISSNQSSYTVLLVILLVIPILIRSIFSYKKIGLCCVGRETYFNYQTEILLVLITITKRTDGREESSGTIVSSQATTSLEPAK